jgi:hypothetical protein
MRSRPVSRGQPQPIQPCIAELLRTCVYPPILVLRVEKILEDDIEKPRLDEPEVHNTPKSGVRKSAYRLYLGDGEIMIQALLAPHLHPLIDLRETTEGSLIELRNYSIRKAPRRSGKGEVIYLGVEDLVCITLSRPTTSHAQEDVLENGGGFMIEDDEIDKERESSTHIQVPSSPVEEMAPQFISSQESCGYETIKADPETVKKRREALHEMSSNARAKRRLEDAEDTPAKRPRSKLSNLKSSQETDSFETIEVNPETTKKRRLTLHDINVQTEASTPTKHASSAGPSEPAGSTTATSIPPTTNPTPSSPLHTLLSLLQPPTPLPPRNYPVTVLAAISWISPTTISQPGSPFPPKRILKLHDPSISSRQVGVSLSVFIDAATFTPRHGTIALFTGVVMQMWGEEVILNAYPTLRGRGWYVDDELALEEEGWDVKEMRKWWAERKRARAVAAAPNAAGANSVAASGKEHMGGKACH